MAGKQQARPLKQLSEIVEVLKQHWSLDEAYPEIAKLVGRPLKTVRNQTRQWFKEGGLETPTTYLKSGQVLADDDLFHPDDIVQRADRLQRNYNRRIERKVIDKLIIGNRLEKALVKSFRENPITLTRPPALKKSRAKPKRLLTALWSDIHFGLMVDPREVPGNEYNWEIASRRMAKLCVQLAEWKIEHRDETDLQIVLNGDIIAGIIHTDDARLQPLAEQVEGATRILVACLDYLRHHFKTIRVLCLPGNHDRVKRERQMAQRWDSYAHHIYLAVSMAFRQTKDIIFDIPMSGDGTYELPGSKSLVFATHGDVAPTIKNVGRTIQLTKPVADLNKLNASGEFSKPVRVMLYGHWHQPFTMPCGIGVIVVNGCVIGADSYARNGCDSRNGGFPCQLMFESTADYEFGDSRFVYLRDADRDSIYDKIIDPNTIYPHCAI